MTAFAKIGQRNDKVRQNQQLKRSTNVKNVRQIALFLCKTKPISEALKMIVTLAITITNNNEL